MKRFAAMMAICFAIPLTFGMLQSVNARKPGNDPGENGGGTIFVRFDGGVYQMKDDGSDFTLMPGISVYSQPSHQPHNNKWWFPDSRYVPGLAFEEVVVTSDTGKVVSVARLDDVEPISMINWGIGDAFVSWIGRQWDIDPASATFGQVIDGGVYASTLAYDINGDITGSSSTILLLRMPLVYDPQPGFTEPVPDIRSHDWAPDGTRLVFTNYAGSMMIADWVEDTFAFTLVFPDSINGTSTPPRWSPAGDRILFSGTPPANGPGRPGVYVCNEDGSGLTMIQPWRSTRHGEWAYWSPTGSHLVYRSKDHLLDDTYLVRVGADGSGAVRITERAYGSGFDAVLAIGWR